MPQVSVGRLKLRGRLIASNCRDRNPQYSFTTNLFSWVFLIVPAWLSFIRKAQWKGWHIYNANAGTVERHNLWDHKNGVVVAFRVFCFFWQALVNTGALSVPECSTPMQKAVSQFCPYLFTFQKSNNYPKNMNKVTHKKNQQQTVQS